MTKRVVIELDKDQLRAKFDLTENDFEVAIAMLSMFEKQVLLMFNDIYKFSEGEPLTLQTIREFVSDINVEMEEVKEEVIDTEVQYGLKSNSSSKN